MAAKSKLPPNLEATLLAKAGEGLSTRALSDWLLSEHGVALNATSIARHLKKVRVERSEITRAVVREKLAPGVTADIDILEREQARVEKLSARLHQHAHDALDTKEKGAADSEVELKALLAASATAESYSELALKASDRVKTLTHTKLSFSGAGEEDPDDKRAGLSVIVVPPESDD